MVTAQQIYGGRTPGTSPRVRSTISSGTAWSA